MVFLYRAGGLGGQLCREMGVARISLSGVDRCLMIGLASSHLPVCQRPGAVHAGAVVRFRLGGATFPPIIFYKIFTKKTVIDVNAFAPRDYAREDTSEQAARTAAYQRCGATQSNMHSSVPDGAFASHIRPCALLTHRGVLPGRRRTTGARLERRVKHDATCPEDYEGDAAYSTHLPERAVTRPRGETAALAEAEGGALQASVRGAGDAQEDPGGPAHSLRRRMRAREEAPFTIDEVLVEYIKPDGSVGRRPAMGWYMREDANGWRPVADRAVVMDDPVESLRAARRVFQPVPTLRREERIRRVKARKREWLRRLYGFATTNDETPERADGDSVDLMDLTERAMFVSSVGGSLGPAEPAEGPEGDEDDLLRWTEALDFEAYLADWEGRAATEVAEEWLVEARATRTGGPVPWEEPGAGVGVEEDMGEMLDELHGPRRRHPASFGHGSLALVRSVARGGGEGVLGGGEPASLAGWPSAGGAPGSEEGASAGAAGGILELGTATTRLATPPEGGSAMRWAEVAAAAGGLAHGESLGIRLPEAALERWRREREREAGAEGAQEGLVEKRTSSTGLLTAAGAGRQWKGAAAEGRAWDNLRRDGSVALEPEAGLLTVRGKDGGIVRITAGRERKFQGRDSSLEGGAEASIQASLVSGVSAGGGGGGESRGG